MLIASLAKQSSIHQQEVRDYSKKINIPFPFFTVYILPPLINFYGKLYSVAELVAYGYATFQTNGAAMSPYFNIADYANSGSC
jgi:hypothetical protein